MNDVEKMCFVIAPLGHEGSETRKRSDQVFTYIIEPACKVTGYKAIRADQMSEPGVITTQIIDCIVDAPLLIADLSERNPNVFYELAVRHALRKPYVQIMQAGEPLPFDVSGVRTIAFDYKDLESASRATESIEKSIKACQEGKPVESPISAAVDLTALRLSDKPQERQFAEIRGAIAELGNILNGIQDRVRDPLQLLPAQYLIGVMKEVTASAARMEPIALLTYEETFLALDRASTLLEREADPLSAEIVNSMRAQLAIATRLLEQLLTESGASRVLVARLMERRRSRQTARAAGDRRR